MKILLVTAEHPGRLHGGLGHFIRVHTAGLRKSGHVVKLVFINLMHEDVQEAQETYPVDEVWNPLPSFPTGTQEGRILDSTSSLVWKAALLIKEFEPDVVHCNDRQTYLPFRYFPKVVYSKQLLITDLIGTQAMDSVWFEEMKIERLAVQQSAAVLIYSRFMVGRIHQTLAAKACPIVLPLGIDLDRYHSDKKPGKLKVAFFGRLEDVQKGFFEFLRAMEYLGKSYLEKNIDVSIFGRGDFPEIFDRSLYKFVGFLDGQDLKDAYAKTDVVIMPSRYEPFGFVGLEALASGCLLLATQGLGMDEYLLDGVNFVPIEAHSFDIGEKLKDIVANPRKYQGIIQQAANSIKIWSWERSITAHEMVYKWVAGGMIQKKNQLFSSASWNQILRMKPVCPDFVSDAVLTYVKETLLDPESFYGGIEFKVHSLPGATNLRYPGLQTDDCLNGRLEVLPYGDNQFNTGVFWGALETSMEPSDLLQEANRCCTSKITFVLSLNRKYEAQTLTAESWQEWRTFLQTKLPHWNIQKEVLLSDSDEWHLFEFQRNSIQ